MQKNLGIGKSTLSTWAKSYDNNEGSIPTRGRGNYESDEAKEVARLKKELRDTQDALNIKKSNRHTGKMTKALFLELRNMKKNAGNRRNAG